MDQKMRIIILPSLFILLIFFGVPLLRFFVFIFASDSFIGKQDIMISPVYLGYIVTLITISIASLLSMGKSRKTKYKVWGIVLMIPISLSLGYSIGLTYAFLVENPWAGLLMIFIVPIIFISGLIMLLVGIFKKTAAKK